MLLLRKVTAHIKNQFWKLAFLRITKRSSLCGFDWEENYEKVLRQCKKVSLSWEQIFFYLSACARVCVCVCVTEKKITASKLLQLFCNKCKSSIQKGFWKCRTTNQNILFFALDIDLKMTQKTKKKVASICVMHQKRWRKLKLIWIDYEQSIIEQLMNINIHERFSLLDRNVLAGFMISLFLAAHAPRGSSKNTNSIKPNGNISMKWPKALPFVWEKVLFKQKLKFFC